MVLRDIKDFLSAGRRYEKKQNQKGLHMQLKICQRYEKQSRNLEFVSDVM
jgi:hypothetical protein